MVFLLASRQKSRVQFLVGATRFYGHFNLVKATLVCTHENAPGVVSIENKTKDTLIVKSMRIEKAVKLSAYLPTCPCQM